jgi:two-component system OmpR family response regulator
MDTRKKRILVVDDEEGITFMVKMSLEQTLDYEVMEENDPGHALATAREFKPDLILLDVMMPGMDGGDVAAQFKSDPTMRGIPIVYLTAIVSGEEVPVGGIIRGGHRFIPKPVSIAELISCIEETVAAKN